MAPSNIAIKCSLFNQRQISFLKSNLVVRTDLWAYVLHSRRFGTAALDVVCIGNPKSDDSGDEVRLRRGVN
jgi:hypothetical protein